MKKMRLYKKEYIAFQVGMIAMKRGVEFAVEEIDKFADEIVKGHTSSILSKDGKHTLAYNDFLFEEGLLIVENEKKDKIQKDLKQLFNFELAEKRKGDYGQYLAESIELSPLVQPDFIKSIVEAV